MPGYEQKYRAGGWDYGEEIETEGLEIIFELASLHPPARIMELACGMGFHTNLMAQMGFDVTGNDLSETAIKSARKKYRDITFHHGFSQDMPDVPGYNEAFDGVITRGPSFYHYDLPLSGKNMKNVDVADATKRAFDLIRPGGVFMMTIRTDFSGTHHVDGVHNNVASAYYNFFDQFGELVALTDLEGEVLESDEQAHEIAKEKARQGVVVCVNKK